MADTLDRVLFISETRWMTRSDLGMRCGSRGRAARSIIVGVIREARAFASLR